MVTTAQTTRPSYRPYLAAVTRVERLSPSFVRITFTSPQFVDLGTREQHFEPVSYTHLTLPTIYSV